MQFPFVVSVLSMHPKGKVTPASVDQHSLYKTLPVAIQDPPWGHFFVQVEPTTENPFTLRWSQPHGSDFPFASVPQVKPEIRVQSELHPSVLSRSPSSQSSKPRLLKLGILHAYTVP